VPERRGILIEIIEANKLCAARLLFSVQSFNLARMTNSFEDLISFSNQTFANDKKLSTMRDYYKDRTVFLTGGTGFIGKLLIAKLLK
jgi:FlaA1/EpsC-like NDP-sugar epimerase